MSVYVTIDALFYSKRFQEISSNLYLSINSFMDMDELIDFATESRFMNHFCYGNMYVFWGGRPKYHLSSDRPDGVAGVPGYPVGSEPACHFRT